MGFLGFKQRTVSNPESPRVLVTSLRGHIAMCVQFFPPWEEGNRLLYMWIYMKDLVQ